jgi:hypothetical protein
MPPPPPPPPPVTSSAPVAAPSSLLAAIEKGTKLKKVTTKDKSAPLIGNVNKGGVNSSSGVGGVGGGAGVPSPMSGNPLFANGIPKLQKTNTLKSPQNTLSHSQSGTLKSPQVINSMQMPTLQHVQNTAIQHTAPPVPPNNNPYHPPVPPIPQSAQTPPHIQSPSIPQTSRNEQE